MKVITTHINADFDSLSSMIAAKKLYPDAVLVLPSSREKSLRNFLIHSALYLFDFREEKDIELEKVETLILVDTRQRSRIGEFAKILGRDGLTVHIYDHHPPSKDDIYGEVSIIKRTGATCSILVSILKEKEIEISSHEATVMMLGIYEETGNFTYPSTTPVDFEAASFLLFKGADLNTVSNFLVKEFTPEDIFILNELISNLKIYFIRDIEVYVTEVSLSAYIPDLSALVQRLRDMKNINVIFAIFLMNDKVFIIGRSRIPEVDVGYILSFFDGGGHREAASATVKDMTLLEVKERLFGYLEETIRPLLKAKDIMFFPVKSIDASSTVEEAKNILVKYNINALPVLKEGQVVGIITRQVVEKALFHGLKDVPVREYMIADFTTVEEDDSILKVKDIIIGQNQRFLPVLRDGIICGAITRTDLLKTLEHEIGRNLVYQGEIHEISTKKNLKRLLEERLDEKIIERLKEIGRIADELGYHVFIVGGFVRDIILGLDNMDIDIVVEGDGIRLAEELGVRSKAMIKTYRPFGTAKLIYEDGSKIDIATARLEYYKKPASLPVVECASLKLDLLRRDFTINTLAVSLSDKNFGELIDFFGGLRDIKEKMIKVLHSMSFVEDPTRIFRALRFAERFGFRISKYTMNLLRNARDRSFLTHLSGRRIWTELSLVFLEDAPENIIKNMHELDLLRYIFEGIKFDLNKESLLKRMKEIYKGYEILLHKRTLDRVKYYLFGLLDGMQEKKITEFCERMGMGKKKREKIKEEFANVERLISIWKKGSFARKSEFFCVLDHLSEEARLFLIAKIPSSQVAELVSEYITSVDSFKPSIKGDDLKKMGVKEGPIYRQVMESIRVAKMDGEIKTEEEEINFVKRFLKEKCNGDPSSVLAS